MQQMISKSELTQNSLQYIVFKILWLYFLTCSAKSIKKHEKCKLTISAQEQSWFSYSKQQGSGRTR